MDVLHSYMRIFVVWRGTFTCFGVRAENIAVPARAVMSRPVILT